MDGRELWNHQQIAVDRAKDLPCFGLFFEMGAGKTRTMLEILRYKYNCEKRVMRTLIISPIITLKNWREEFKKFTKVPVEEISILHGSEKKRIELLGAPSHIKITNYEAVLMEDLLKAMFKWRPEILILDESHKAKNMKAKRTKRLITLSDLTPQKFIMTGTPVLNTPMDLFSQFRILDGGQSFGKNFFAFRNSYFYDKNAGMPTFKYFPNWQIRPGAFEKLNQIVARKSMHVKKEDCLDLPPFIQQNVHVELTPEQRRAYEEMKKDFITYLGDKAAVATIALTKALRMQQIISGFVSLEGGSLTRLDSSPRIAALSELLVDLTPNHKVIVWAIFKENYAQIKEVCEYLKIKYVEVHGGIGERQKFENVDLFNKDPETRVFIGNPGAGGIGINLTSASYSIFYSRGFSLEHDLQAEARNYRGGSEIHNRITRIDIVAADTLDELIQSRLAMKEEIGEKILRDIANEL